ncbi:uromodulin [Lates calcarifer]|uniref:Uromodulin n=1 Tax=Lates calcarifer TaxID=8187 RepID=A0A4W6CHQ0_LATCA|nr:uromodulin [Lates calcarifer]
MSPWFIHLLLLLLMTAHSAQSTATSCDACHKLARCLTSIHDNNVETVDVSCRCEDSVVGDGFICYNKTTCNSDCCGRGYRWSPLQGCIDIDECSLTPPPCGPGQLCENTPGSFSCLVSPVPQHHTAAITEPHSVVFACGNTQCPVGQDCLQVNGAARCTDPCQHYTPLRDAWRATDFKVDSASAVCDNRVWQGWYRLYIGNNGVQMPERCIEKYMCGTHAPLWLQTPHPQKSHGIIQGMVCGSWETGCCHFKSNPIHVKACPGNYYVYKFVSPNTCRLAYCADVNTIVCNTCTENQTCVSDDKVNWRCERNEPELDCGQDHLRVMIPKRVLQEQGLNASSAHLSDPSCHEQVDHQGEMWYLVERRKDVCGNVVKTNGTHIMYSNILFVYPSDWTNASLPIPMSIPFSCTFPLDDVLSLNSAIRYQLPGGSVGMVRSGDPIRATMTLYRGPDYSQPFPAGPVSLPLGSALHVGVSVENNDNGRFVLILENCYFTNTPSAEDPVQYALIQNRCPVDRRHVTVGESGLSQRAHFSALLFLYHGTYDDVYLHCRVSLCDLDSAPCRPNCSRRQARSTAASSNQLPVTVGPISWF